MYMQWESSIALLSHMHGTSYALSFNSIPIQLSESDKLQKHLVACSYMISQVSRGQDSEENTHRVNQVDTGKPESSNEMR